MPKVDRITLKGTFSTRDEAAALLPHPGDAAFVHRGVPRMLLLNCPCGCGDILVINLDRRAGSAWRFYQRDERFTLYPSYWRDTKCKSHFILWNNQIFWCDWDEDAAFWIGTSQIEQQVVAKLPSTWVSYDEIAGQLGELPWDVLQACHALVKQRRAEMHPNRRLGQFRRLTS